MKTVLTALLMFFLSGSSYEAAVPYFSRVRNVTASSSERQNYFVVDADIWKFARPDFIDLRLYDGQVQVPYALIEQSGGSSSQESSSSILNLGKVGDHTEFDLDVRGLNQYSRVRLGLDAKNFINNVRVQGRHPPMTALVPISAAARFMTSRLKGSAQTSFSSSRCPAFLICTCASHPESVLVRSRARTSHHCREPSHSGPRPATARRLQAV